MNKKLIEAIDFALDEIKKIQDQDYGTYYVANKSRISGPSICLFFKRYVEEILKDEVEENIYIHRQFKTYYYKIMGKPLNDSYGWLEGTIRDKTTGKLKMISLEKWFKPRIEFLENWKKELLEN